VKVIGTEEALKKAYLILGQYTSHEISMTQKEEMRSCIITNPKVIGKTLYNLNFNTLWKAEITQITRSGIKLIPSANTRLRYGDKVLITVNKDTADSIIKLLGGLEANTVNFLPISLIIVIGIVLGQFSFSIFGQNIGPGVSGGILITTLLLGHLGKTGPLLWSIAGKTNQFLRELGIMFFLCGIGSNSSQGLIKALTEQGMRFILSSFFVVSTTILMTSLILIKVLKMNKLRVIGVLAGSFTCAAALPSASEIENSSIPLTAYSVTYPFALFTTILFTQLFLYF
jgi:putative transport protein